MSSLRVRLSQLTNKKVPALALVVVAMLGMVAGVLAANLVVTSTSSTGEIGTYHTNGNTMTVTDNGLGVVANTAGAVLTNTFPPSGSNVNVTNALVAGHWFEKVTFVDTATDSAAHSATVTVRNGTGPNGLPLAAPTFTLTGPGGTGSTGTITAYVDLGTNTLTSPITVYVNVS
jgi:hypothetical protein